jgi:cytochrome c553
LNKPTRKPNLNSSFMYKNKHLGEFINFATLSRGGVLSTALSAGIATVIALTSASAVAKDVVGDADRAAKDKVSHCIGCHGIPNYNASFPNVYRVPMIAGQSEKYLYNALQAYKKGDRSHPSMKGVAWSLSDQDMADLAAYYAQGASARSTVQAAAPAASK